ncbi:MAG: RNA polymerase sigma factor [Ruminococcus sp.]
MENAEFQRIAEKFTDIIFRTALSYCNSKSDAEDAVQNAFYKLLKSDISFNDDEHIRRWLIKVVINECKMMWRTYWHKNVISFEELTNEPEYIEVEHKELFNEIMKLPQKYRTVLHLYYYEGYSCDEIAHIMKLTTTTVQTRLMRARNKLKEQLEEM